MNGILQKLFVLQFLVALMLAAAIVMFAMNARANVVLDLKDFSQTDRISRGFTSVPFSLVRGRFCGTAANVSERQVVSFAPTSASGLPNEVFAANSAHE